MRQAKHHLFNMTQVTSFGFLMALLSLVQPISIVSAQQPTGLVTHETGGTGFQGQRIENLDPNRPYLNPTKSLEKKDAQGSTHKPHRLIRKPQNAPIASVEPLPSSGSSPISSLPTPPPSLQRDNTTPQSIEPSMLHRSVGAAASLATTSVAPSSAITKGSIAAGTVPTGTIPLAAAGVGNSSTSGSGSTGGRSMSRLAAELPGLAQLMSPPAAPVVSVNPAVNPAIGASPASFAFTAQTGTNPAAQALSLSNTGGGTLTWSASSSNAPWLTLSQVSGTGNGTVTLTVATGTLATGPHNGTITLTAAGAASVSIPVSFTVTAAPTLTVTPSSLTFTATQGAANPINQTISVTSNTIWAVSKSGSWLTTNPTSGPNNGTITVSVNTANATIGSNPGTITVTEGGITRSVTVTLVLNAPATSSVTLTWNTNSASDLAGYKVYRANSSGAYGLPIATLTGNVTSYVAAGLQPGTQYFFVVTAYDSSGNESAASNEVSKNIL